jgi:16S rRNA (cytidine1402-2'-O)-methyltransferase
MQTTSAAKTTKTPKTLFSVVATPIGNLEDITLRAIRTLKEADLVLCEDTRVTRTLFQKYGISTPTLSYHARSTMSKVETILEMLASPAVTSEDPEKNGGKTKKVALVSDAGTPGISDPGALLVAKIRERFTAEIASGEMKIEAIPGPSAFVAALSIAGVPCADFTFLGFLPHKKGRETLFKEMVASDRTTIFYESPHRILKTLEALDKELATFSASSSASISKKLVIGRELTKVFEEIIRGTPVELTFFFKNNPEKIRGEFVVIVAPQINEMK